MKSYSNIFIVFGFVAISFVARANEFKVYFEAAQNKNLGMNTRWESLMKSAEFASTAEAEQIKSFSGDDQWYMRNASLVALLRANREMAYDVAKKLLQDKALVVRSAAVDVLAKNLNLDHKKLLIGEMDKAYNFNRKSSLWIRKQIVEKIAESQSELDKPFFSKYVFDSDENVSNLSAVALEKITGKSFGGKSVEKWRAYVKENKWQN